MHVDPTAPVPTRLLWREVRAELALARGDRRHAHDHVRAGLADLHAWQSSFGSLDLQSTLVGHGRDLARLGLRLAVEQDDPDLVYEWSERARALVGRVPPVRPPADEELAADLTELRVLGGTTGEEPRVEELRERVRRHQWYAEGAGAVGEHATLEELRAALAERRRRPGRPPRGRRPRARAGADRRRRAHPRPRPARPAARPASTPSSPT